MGRRSPSPRQSLQRARQSPAQQGPQTQQRHRQPQKPALLLPRLRLKRQRLKPSRLKRHGNKRKLGCACMPYPCAPVDTFNNLEPVNACGKERNQGGGGGGEADGVVVQDVLQGCASLVRMLLA